MKHYTVYTKDAVCCENKMFIRGEKFDYGFGAGYGYHAECSSCGKRWELGSEYVERAVFETVKTTLKKPSNVVKVNGSDLTVGELIKFLADFPNDSRIGSIRIVGTENLVEGKFENGVLHVSD